MLSIVSTLERKVGAPAVAYFKHHVPLLGIESLNTFAVASLLFPWSSKPCSAFAAASLRLTS
eukprot:scaffold87784_cov19-Tisochrysis_lutea.AAC.1